MSDIREAKMLKIVRKVWWCRCVISPSCCVRPSIVHGKAMGTRVPIAQMQELQARKKADAIAIMTAVSRRSSSSYRRQ